MTKLTKKVQRESDASVYERSKYRAIIVSVEPPDRIGFRLKGTQRSYTLPIAMCFRIAVEAEVESRRALKKRAKLKKGGK